MTDSNPNLYTSAAAASNIHTHCCDMPGSHSFLFPNSITQANTSMASNLCLRVAFLFRLALKRSLSMTFGFSDRISREITE
ncbi:hypothetical protein COLO4_37498 [Corchorus olitorius]|uniref:Uncharacterized protein n=1 Tax=Corchorus olitorius TaxID=93759 RepID=A0A1R3G144_9ROSI|nr:hypothetical protein COLO4_37498 [Corchorus olitorius]